MSDIQHIPHQTGEMAAVAKLPYSPALAVHLATCLDCGDRLCDTARAIVASETPMMARLVPMQDSEASR